MTLGQVYPSHIIHIAKLRKRNFTLNWYFYSYTIYEMGERVRMIS